MQSENGQGVACIIMGRCVNGAGSCVQGAACDKARKEVCRLMGKEEKQSAAEQRIKPFIIQKTREIQKM